MQSLFSGEDLVLEYPTIYGISTPLRHLRLGVEVAKHNDFRVEYSESIDLFELSSSHEVYLLTHLDDGLQFLLLKNKGTKSLFYSKYKAVDYLVCSLHEDEIDDDVIKKLKTIKGVSICFALDKPAQKEIQNFTQLL